MAPIEVESVDFQVQVAEAGTLQEDELEVSDLHGASDEPAEEIIGRLVLAEEDERSRMNRLGNPGWVGLNQAAPELEHEVVQPSEADAKAGGRT